MQPTDMDLANTVPEETNWEESNLTPGLEQLLEQERHCNKLEDLVSKSVGVRDKASLEALQENYKGIPNVAKVSLEQHVGTITKKQALTKAIQDQYTEASLLLAKGLEDYVGDIKEDFGEKLKSYQKITTKLSTTDANLESTDKKTIGVNHTRVYEMFHVKEQFQGKELLATIRKESVNMDRLTTMVGTAVSRVKKDINDLGKEDTLSRKAQDLPKVDRMFLMFNRRAAILDGQLEYKDLTAKSPKKFNTWKQDTVIFISAIFFGPAGYNAAKHFTTPKGNTAKVENKLGDIHRFIKYVEGMEDTIDDLSGHIDELVKLFTKVDESNHSALNRRAAPIMELAEFIVKHVTDITRGTDTLFSRLVRKN